MDRCLVSVFLLLPLLFSVGHAALTLHDIWNMVLPGSASSSKPVSDHLPHGKVMSSSLPTAGDAGEVVDHNPKFRVDAGTKVWPFVYYSRSDTKGTLDWGTMGWPHIYYTKGYDWGNDAPSHNGRKAGDGFRL